MEKHFTSPLSIYVLWHPEFGEGQLMANHLFSTFTRNSSSPFARTIGIPVYFRSDPVSNNSRTPISIPLAEAKYNAIIVLVDDHMVIDEDWREYVTQLDKEARESGGNTRLFPVATNFNSFNFPVSATNYFRLFEVEEEPPKQEEKDSPAAQEETISSLSPEISSMVEVPFELPKTQGRSVQLAPRNEGITININLNLGDLSDEDVNIMDLATEAEPSTELNNNLFHRQAAFLVGKLVHELSRMLYGQPLESEGEHSQSVPPVRLFISHAKADGAEIAESIRDYIHQDTSLKSFFDANDIAVGYLFSDELKAAIAESSLICIQTDYYATREWCLWEVINAKRMDRPVVVVNAILNREPRSFPYIGNVPTMRWDFNSPAPKIQIQQVLTFALYEVLGNKFNNLFQEELKRIYRMSDSIGVVGHAPELFTVLKMQHVANAAGHTSLDPLLVLYPDPPLGDEELQVLKEVSDQIRFITPTMIPLLPKKSISDLTYPSS